MTTWMTRLFWALGIAALAAAPALAGPPAGPPRGGEDGPEGRVLTHVNRYVRMEPLLATVQADYRVQGILLVGVGLDVPKSRDRTLVAEREVWLRAAYSEVMMTYGGRIYRWGEVPNAALIADLLQQATDRIIGPDRATVILDSVMLNDA